MKLGFGDSKHIPKHVAIWGGIFLATAVCIAFAPLIVVLLCFVVAPLFLISLPFLIVAESKRLDFAKLFGFILAPILPCAVVAYFDTKAPLVILVDSLIVSYFAIFIIAIRLWHRLNGHWKANVLTCTLAGLAIGLALSAAALIPPTAWGFVEHFFSSGNSSWSRDGGGTLERNGIPTVHGLFVTLLEILQGAAVGAGSGFMFWLIGIALLPRRNGEG